MKKQLELIADLMKEMKAKFSAPVITTKFETAVLMDGTVVEWEEELGVGTLLFVVDGENRVPAPEGVHVLEDGRSVRVDENGAIAEIIEVEMNNEPQAEQMSADKVTEIVNAKMSEVVEMFSKGFESMTAMFEAQTAELTALKSDFETFKATPSDPSKENQKFNRQGEDSNLTAKQNLLLKNLKKK
jgi:hypothetical protein